MIGKCLRSIHLLAVRSGIVNLNHAQYAQKCTYRIFDGSILFWWHHDAVG